MAAGVPAASVHPNSAARLVRLQALSGALIFACAIVSGGCYFWFAKSGVSSEQLARDKYECQREAGVFRTDVRDCLEARGYSTSIIPWRAPVLAQQAPVARVVTPPEPTKSPFLLLTEQR